MKKALERGSLMGCSIDVSGDMNSNHSESLKGKVTCRQQHLVYCNAYCIRQVSSASELESRTPLGLVRGHAYSIIGLAEVQSSAPLRLDMLFAVSWNIAPSTSSVMRFQKTPKFAWYAFVIPGALCCGRGHGVPSKNDSQTPVLSLYDGLHEVIGTLRKRFQIRNYLQLQWVVHHFNRWSGKPKETNHRSKWVLVSRCKHHFLFTLFFSCLCHLTVIQNENAYLPFLCLD